MGQIPVCAKGRKTTSHPVLGSTTGFSASIHPQLGAFDTGSYSYCCSAALDLGRQEDSSLRGYPCSVYSRVWGKARRGAQHHFHNLSGSPGARPSLPSKGPPFILQSASPAAKLLAWLFFARLAIQPADSIAKKYWHRCCTETFIQLGNGSNINLSHSVDGEKQEFAQQRQTIIWSGVLHKPSVLIKIRFGVGRRRGGCFQGCSS